MAQVLTDAIIRKLPAPKERWVAYYDAKVKGLSVRVLPEHITKDGKVEITKSFCLSYTTAGLRKIYTIGRVEDWTDVSAVRKHTKELKHRIRYEGYDPAAELKADREAPTVADLCERFTEEHLPKLRASTRGDYKRMIEADILPDLRNHKVALIKYEDIERLHRKITKRGAPSAANFCRALLSKLFTLAVKWRWIDQNPCKGVARNPTEPRSRYLDTIEIASLTKALAAYPDQDMADIFRVLILTGCRRGEAQAATWAQFNLDEGRWTKPSSHTKQKKEHRVPLSAPAKMLLVNRRAAADTELKELKRKIAKAAPAERRALEERKRRVETFVFPARNGETGHVTEIKKAWSSICTAAGIVVEREVINPRTGKKRIVKKHAARVHDLRHTAASIMASSGASLPLIGQLLGHTQPATTARYVSLFEDAQRAAAERLGAAVTGGPSVAEVIDIKSGQRR